MDGYSIHFSTNFVFVFCVLMNCALRKVPSVLVISILVMHGYCLVNADPLCDIVSATNIQSAVGHSQWSCSSVGVTSTSPCTWPGIICISGSVVSINVAGIGLTG